MIVSYLKLQEEYSEKYGDRTVVLIQVGSFYETYEYDPSKDTEVRAWPDQRLGHSVEIGGLLNMVVTRKDKGKPYSLTNVDMVGFPMVAYAKHRDVLLGNDFTIVRVDQKKDASGKVERFVGEVLSPATQIENLSQVPMANNIVSLYIEVLEESRNFEDFTIAVGTSCVDVTTGENKVLEVYSRDQNNVFPLQEIYRFLSSVRPRETICHLVYKSSHKKDHRGITDKSSRKEGKNLIGEGDRSAEYAKFLETALCLPRTSVVHINNIPSEYLKLDYCTRFFSKVFSESQVLLVTGIVEDLGLERVYYGMVSYVVLLQYCYEHNQVLIEKLSKPNTDYLDGERFLVLTHNAVDQLDILPGKSKPTRHNRNQRKIDSLFSVIDFTQTALGKRLLLKRLTHPIQSGEKLEKSYNRIGYLLSNSIPDLTKLLKRLPDLERYQRKLYLKLVKPNEFSLVFQAYHHVVALYTILLETETSAFQDLLFDPTEFNQCLELVLGKWDMETLALAKLEGEQLVTEERIFHPGQDEKADQLWGNAESLKAQLSSITDYLNSYLGSTKGKKLEEVDVDRLGFLTTAHKAKVLLASQYNPDFTGTLKTVTVNKDVLITSDKIAQLAEKWKQTRSERFDYLYRSYQTFLSQISKYKFFSKVDKFVAELDLAVSAAASAKANKYYCPKLVQRDQAYCHIANMRHPVVEAVINSPYVANTVTLGETVQGLLVYGMNSCGKSTLAKAVALNVIMAQAGLFVAGEMILAPFSQIITRLSGHDDLLQGESSFVVEMKELRTVLRQADSRTLVVADELCRGTENISATSLTVPALQTLVRRKSCFIFSSHNHSLPEFQEIRDLEESLQICHLSLRYDEKTNSLVYSRELKPGPGDSVYGLEVASSLGLDKDYISSAYKFRNQLLGQPSELLSTKKSKYNGKVYVDSCFLCGERDSKLLETHHIREQHTFTETDGQQKNVPGNLVDMCEKCHSYLHGKGFRIIPVETSRGIELSVAK